MEGGEGVSYGARNRTAHKTIAVLDETHGHLSKST